MRGALPESVSPKPDEVYSRCEGFEESRSNLVIRGKAITKQYFVYIMTNKYNTVLYTGVTSNLQRRMIAHKAKMFSGFTRKYNVNKLVYYEVYDNPYTAIAREKQIKGGSRRKKIELIDKMNYEWNDLAGEINGIVKEIASPEAGSQRPVPTTQT